MTSPKHEKLEQLFSAALNKDTWAERMAFLEGACGDDPDLQSQVNELLQVHDRIGSFLDTPPIDPDATLEIQTRSEATGTKIGRYKILQEIGEGGFGVVYMAEQEEPVRRHVALKIIKAGMDTRQVIARFEAERQALALMDHPNIARVFDAGATEAGRPYFVMELVKGITITEYCDKHKLSMRERLELFLPVCHAVQHAHQKGIIHRDLKPNNVLVTLHDSKPVPKVIDFGIAKATSQRLTEKTLFTGFREFLGTPEYMSPDQADISGLDVDTRTDIYSLGVLLYELLTGTTPFDASAMRDVSFEEIRRTIREVEPPKPSTRLQTLNGMDNGEAIAKLRRSEPLALSRLIRGDLDWIVMRAMEKDRTRRYATAKDLADDVERHLMHEPVEAGPPSAAYKFSKFFRRHRVGVLVGSLVGFTLLIGLSLAVVGLIQANRARAGLQAERNAAEAARAAEQQQRTSAEASADEAQKQAAKATTVNKLLQEMLASVDPSKALGREVTVRYVLDEAARKIDEEETLAEQPQVEAAIRMTLGETYAALGLYDDAEKHLREAHRLWSAELGDRDSETLRSNCALGGALRLNGKLAEAESRLSETAEAQRLVLGDEHLDTLTTRNELALAYRGSGRFSEAESIHRSTLEIQERVLGEEEIDTLESMGHLGMVCHALGKSDEAERLLRKALETCRRVLTDEHPCTTSAMNNLGLFLEDQLDHERAEDLFRRAYEVDYRILGPDHPLTGIRMNDLLRVLRNQGKLDDMQPLLAEGIARLRRATQRRDANALAFHEYAWVLLECESLDLRDPEAALPAAERAVELDGGMDVSFLETLARAHQMTGNLQQAIETQQEAIARAQDGGPYNRADLQGKLVELLIQNGDLVEAAALSWEGIPTYLSDSLITGATPGASLIIQSETLQKQGRFEEAASLLRKCLEIQREELTEGNWLIANTTSLLGGAVAGEGKFTEAEPLLLDSYAAIAGNRRAPENRQRQALDRIIQLYESWDKPDRAADWRLVLEEAGGDGVGGS